MKKTKAMKIIEQIAIAEGVSIFEVRLEMQKAINVAYENRDNSKDDFWNKWQGRKPTPEEFIVSANQEVLERMNFGKLN